VIAGDNQSDGEYARLIAERVEAQGIGGLVRRVGHCTDMPAAYAIADLVAVPSLQPTTFNQIAAEAQAMARPVVASSIGALPEIVLAPPRVPDAARTGWVCAPDDPIALARAVSAALTLGSAVRQAIAIRARRHAELSYSPARIAAATLGVYSARLEAES
jgi:glycosyltransferase involved in cell wall biosynthesis